MFNRRYLIAFLFAAILFLAGCGAKNNPENIAPAEDNSPIIFFYGKECPHCQNVEDYFSKNNVSERIQFSQREVYHNKANAALLAEKARDCGITDESIGVPFLWNGGQCIVGDADIISFFREQLEK